MTRDRALKRAVRERAASTGEKYTQARRALRDTAGDAARNAVSAASGEFDRQLATLIERGYPRAAGLSGAAFSAAIEPLRGAAAALDPATDPDAGRFAS